MQKILRYLKNNQSGFSLMEVLAVLFIMTIGLVGILSLTLQNIQVEDINKNRLVARQLSQEGIELIRRKRDTNWLQTGNCILVPSDGCWKEDINAGTYKIDYRYLTPIAVTGISETRLQNYAAGDDINLYAHDASEEDSPFYRLITISEPGINSLLVKSYIEWNEHGQTYSYVAETLLYDWY